MEEGKVGSWQLAVGRDWRFEIGDLRGSADDAGGFAFGFDLADVFAGDVELVGDVLQGVVGVVHQIPEDMEGAGVELGGR